LPNLIDKGVDNTTIAAETTMPIAEEDFFRTAFEYSPVGMCLLDLEARFVRANSVMCRLVGRKEAQLRDTSIIDVTLPDDQAAWRTCLDSLTHASVAEARFESRCQRPSGETVWVALGLRLQRDSGGAPAFFLVHAQDITEHKREEESLHENEEKFRIAFENAPTGMSIIGADGKYLAVNPMLCQMFGYSEDELLAGTLNRVTHPDDVERGKVWIRKMIAGEPCEPEFEKRFIHKDGHLVWGVVTARWLRDPDGRARICIAHIRDITFRKQAEVERNRLEAQLHRAQRMEAIGQLAGGVAHDFNNLLTAIGGNASFAMMDLPRDSPVRGSIFEIQKAVDSAANLTRQLLAFSRQQVVAPKVLDLNDVVRNLYKMLTRLIGEDVEFSTELAGDLGRVRIDRGQIDQILINLAVNARDAMENGGKLTLGTANVVLDASYCSNHPQLAPGNYVLLTVSDNGVGMSPDVKARLFEPFFTTKEMGRGTGLGLAMVYGAVKQHQGHIDVYSELGQGTTFKIYLPSVEEPADSAQTKNLPPLIGGDETIFLVEDDPSVRQLALYLLHRHGYNVLPFGSGHEAIAAMRTMTEPVHLLVTDVVMPGMNGRILAEACRELRPTLKVLFTSGYPHNVIVHHGVLEEGIEFLPKPYALDALVRRVREVLGPAERRAT
jgi:two-component system, cell cycle sensor histidine kinase and response regulator CckA